MICPTVSRWIFLLQK